MSATAPPPYDPDARPLKPTTRIEREAPGSREKLEGYFRVAALVLLLLVAFVATFRAYFALEGAITTWLEYQWVPVAQAVFSLIVLAASVYLLRTWVIARAR